MTASEVEGSGGTASGRSGDFSKDPRFDPDSLFHINSVSENAEQIAAAVLNFVRTGDDGVFARAVAVYVRSARAREQRVERVLAALKETVALFQPADVIDTRERLQHILMDTFLLAYYGASSAARHERRLKYDNGDSSAPPAI